MARPENTSRKGGRLEWDRRSTVSSAASEEQDNSTRKLAALAYFHTDRLDSAPAGEQLSVFES
ncbi:MAG: hypothetical protein HXY20_14085 [Acidobacteria bacterium]|nr:hypothetical protein [Acidobacteriota bacterium]